MSDIWEWLFNTTEDIKCILHPTKAVNLCHGSIEQWAEQSGISKYHWNGIELKKEREEWQWSV